MENRPWTLGMVFLLVCLVVACGGPTPAPAAPTVAAPTVATPTVAAPTVENALYDHTTLILSFILSDGSTVEADLGSLVADAGIEPEDVFPKSGDHLKAMGYEYNTVDQTLTVALPNGAVIQANLSEPITARILSLPPSDTNAEESMFKTVSAGEDYTCGLMADASVACWGSDQYGRSTPPEGEFRFRQRGSGPRLRYKGEQLRGLLGP